MDHRQIADKTVCRREKAPGTEIPGAKLGGRPSSNKNNVVSKPHAVAACKATVFTEGLRWLDVNDDFSTTPSVGRPRRLRQRSRGLVSQGNKQTKRGAISEEVAKILTEPQREQFKVLRAEHKARRAEHRIERLQERLGLSAEQTADVRRIFQQARDKQTKRGAISEEVAKILTEPQREQFKVLQAEHKARKAAGHPGLSHH